MGALSKVSRDGLLESVQISVPTRVGIDTTQQLLEHKKNI
jgi:hypothetical protein